MCNGGQTLLRHRRVYRIYLLLAKGNRVNIPDLAYGDCPLLDANVVTRSSSETSAEVSERVFFSL